MACMAPGAKASYVLQVAIHIPIVGLMQLEPDQCQQAHPPQLFVTYKEFLKGSLSGDSRLFDHFFFKFLNWDQ